MAAARQMLGGKAIYRDIWFDKPPLVPSVCLLWGARAGWLLRLAGALYALLACWIAFRFARDLWSRREGLWAGRLTRLLSHFRFRLRGAPSGFRSPDAGAAPGGRLAGLEAAPVLERRARRRGISRQPQGPPGGGGLRSLEPAGALLMAAGFAAVGGAAAAWLWSAGALAAYWDEVWMWGRLYAGSTFVADPLRNGIVRTLDWLGFHAAWRSPALPSWPVAKFR